MRSDAGSPDTPKEDDEAAVAEGPAPGDEAKSRTKKRPEKEKAEKEKAEKKKKSAKETGSKQVDTKDGKGKKTRKAKPVARDHRYAVVYDTDRPHIRLGVIWFVLLAVALVVGQWGLAVVYALPAAVGALQTAKAWRRRGQGPFMPVAGLAALALVLTAPLGARVVGVVVLVAVAASLIAGSLEPGRPGSALGAAGFTVRSWLFIGLAGASVVLVHAYQPSAAVALVILVSAYEAGDYVIGSGSPNVVEGPVAGIAAVAVFSFSLFVVEPSPFQASGVLLFGAVVAVLAPLGQLAASAVLPASGAVASGLRRLDSLLLVGPAWVVLLQAGVGQ